jgi:hypothetical protein
VPAVSQQENRIQLLFSERFGLSLRKIPEADVPTPDFKMYAGTEEIAVLEVKVLESTAPGVTPSEMLQNGLTPDAQVDNCAGRVAKKIHEAVRQFERSTLPTVLVLLSNDDACDKFDLQEALGGSLSYGEMKITTLRPETARRAAGDKSEIDLYVWVDGRSEEDPGLVTTSAIGRALRFQYFDPRLTKHAD